MLFSLAACGKKDATETGTDNVSTGEQRKNVVEVDKETGEEYYLLADFENYFECTQVKYAASFGKVTQIKKSENPDLVTYGEQSVKLEILGTESSWNFREPNMRFSTNTGFFNLTSDFSNMSRLTFDIYNAQDYEAAIRFYIDANISPRNTMVSRTSLNLNNAFTRETEIFLKPGWNHIEIPAEEMKLVAYDDEGKAYYQYGEDVLKGVGGFHIQFDRGEIHEEQEVFYFDNLRAYLK